MILSVVHGPPKTPAEIHRKLQKERKSKTGKLEAKAEGLTGIIDTREQKPFSLSPLKTTTLCLPTGDYSLLGYEHLICVERKSVSDFVNCMGHGRERFERELERMEAFPYKMIICEGSFVDIATGNFHGRLNPQSAMGTVASWQMRIPIFFAGHRTAAELMTVRFLIQAANQPCPRCKNIPVVTLEE